MILKEDGYSGQTDGVPRVGGGDPALYNDVVIYDGCSPRRRG